MNTPQNSNLLEQAKSTSCIKTLHQLSDCVDATIRRAVARNINTLAETLERLANDPVLNVSFMAVQNPNCLTKKEFEDISHPCVLCEKDERYMVCVNCSTLEEYYK